MNRKVLKNEEAFILCIVLKVAKTLFVNSTSFFSFFQVNKKVFCIEIQKTLGALGEIFTKKLRIIFPCCFSTYLLLCSKHFYGLLLVYGELSVLGVKKCKKNLTIKWPRKSVREMYENGN